MSLLTDWQARASSEARINLSNPQNSGATTVDTTREGLAATDAEADFAAACGVAYSSSVATHVSAGILFVMERLRLYTGQTDIKRFTEWMKFARETYAVVLGRNRLVPTSDSTLQPTTAPSNAAPFDDFTQYQRFTGNAPGAPTVTNSGGESGFPLGE
jgi:hypothetical protein